MRTCTKCSASKPLPEFSPDKRMALGVKSWCKACCTAFRVARLDASPALRKRQVEINRARRTDPVIAERDRAAAKAWNEANRERYLANVSAWKKANPHKAAAHSAAKNEKRRLRKVSWADQEKIVAVYAEAARLTLETQVPHHVDHIIPLLGRRVSGLHVHTNLQVLTADANRQKLNKYDDLQ